MDTNTNTDTNTKPNTDANAAAERLLGDIIEAAEMAIDCAAGEAEATRADVYRLALDRIRAMAAMQPSAVELAGGMKQTTVSLPELKARRVERMGRVYGIHVCSCQDNGFLGALYLNGNRVASVLSNRGKVVTAKMLDGMMHALAFHAEKRNRRALRKRSAK